MSDPNFSPMPADRSDKDGDIEELEQQLRYLIEFTPAVEETEEETIDRLESSEALERELISIMEFYPAEIETHGENEIDAQQKEELETELFSEISESSGIHSEKREYVFTAQDFDTIEAEFLVSSEDENDVEVSASVIPESSLTEAACGETEAAIFQEDLIEGFEEFETEDRQIIERLQQQNQALVDTVTQLEQALAESQQQLQSQIRRSRSADSLIAQQAEEIDKTQEQIAFVVNELELARQTSQRQQLVIENLSEELELSQQHMAKLERECVLLQEGNNTKEQKLIISEKQIQELNSRLLRQQRYTLQYKAALQQCLEVPVAQVGDRPIASQISSIQPWAPHQSIVESPAESLEDVLTLSAPVEINVELEDNLTQSHGDRADELAALEIADLHEEFTPSDTKQESLESAKTSVSGSSNSPSPLLSYIPPAKKRKSNIAVDLPAFLRPRSS